MFGSKCKCKHAWEVKVDKVLPSFMDRMKEGGRAIKIGALTDDMYQSTHIVIMACRVCGKIDKTVTRG